MGPYDQATLAISSASILFSASIIILYLVRPSIRKSDYANYVLVLVTLDLFLSMCYTIPSFYNSDDFCIVEIAFKFLIFWWEAIWTSVIALAMYREVYLEQGRNTFPFKKYLHFAFLLALALTIMSLIVRVISSRSLGGICFGYKNNYDYFFYILIFYFPFWLLSLWNIYAFIKI